MFQRTDPTCFLERGTWYEVTIDDVIGALERYYGKDSEQSKVAVKTALLRIEQGEVFLTSAGYYRFIKD